MNHLQCTIDSKALAPSHSFRCLESVKRLFLGSTSISIESKMATWWCVTLKIYWKRKLRNEAFIIVAGLNKQTVAWIFELNLSCVLKWENVRLVDSSFKDWHLQNVRIQQSYKFIASHTVRHGVIGDDASLYTRILTNSCYIPTGWLVDVGCIRSHIVRRSS